MGAYTGYLTRKGHYSPPNDVAPGVNTDHTHPNPEPDPFNPQPDVPANQAGDVWNPTENHFVTGYSPAPVAHWFNGELAVPSSMPTYGAGQQVMQDRMMADHSVLNYVPDSIRLYQHASEGVSIDWQLGRAPQHAGESVGESQNYLMMGRNSYDVTNQPNEVYSADQSRYRLGTRITMFGLYDSPLGKFGQDASLRAYTGLTPQFPADKVQMNQNAAPYTPNSSGTATWTLPSFQVPRLFGLPTETSLTDYTISTQDAALSSDFASDDGRL
jgi:hypothetical protein